MRLVVLEDYALRKEMNLFVIGTANTFLEITNDENKSD